jgi:hypothetical protein
VAGIPVAGIPVAGIPVAGKSGGRSGDSSLNSPRYAR